MHEKHPIHWARGRHFHLFLGCNSPLVSHQQFNELGNDHHIGKDWTWTPQKTVTRGQCWWFQFRSLHAHMRRQRWLSWVSFRHLAGRLERYQAATKCLWTMRAETRRPVRLISYILILDDDWNLFLLMIWIRARSSLHVVILNWCPCGLWIALPVSRTQRRTLEMPPCGTPVFLDIALWDSPQPANWTMR